MTPYYDEGGITIYHGDCREILPALEFALILTDPPYGINYDSTHKKYRHGISRDLVFGDAAPFDPTHLLGLGRLFLWGGNCFASRLPDASSWAVWVKTVRQDANIRQSDCELAWTNCLGRSRVFNHLWIGAYRDSESGERNRHPTQKPVALMLWCLRIVGTVGCVCDPYCGCGSTLVAAKQYGCRAIGIEIEERYCEIAAKRLAQGVLEFG